MVPDGILPVLANVSITYINETAERFLKFDLSHGVPYREIVGSLMWIGEYFECINVTQPDWNGKYCFLGPSTVTPTEQNPFGNLRDHVGTRANMHRF